MRTGFDADVVVGASFAGLSCGGGDRAGSARLLWRPHGVSGVARGRPGNGAGWRLLRSVKAARHPRPGGAERHELRADSGSPTQTQTQARRGREEPTIPAGEMPALNAVLSRMPQSAHRLSRLSHGKLRGHDVPMSEWLERLHLGPVVRVPECLDLHNRGGTRWRAPVASEAGCPRAKTWRRALAPQAHRPWFHLRWGGSSCAFGRRISFPL
jgi:hypothetical protein